MIGVAPDVYLEVLDCGGSGPPIVLLAGAGSTAHDYDEFAPKLAAFGRVYGITRRGLGASSRADSGYDADQLGNDILAVIDSLGLARPILIGHSFAGEELSSIGSRRPDRVGGLVYLDAGYSYAFYESTRGNAGLELADIRRKIDRVQSGQWQTTRNFRRSYAKWPRWICPG
jgi:non-heme chloroperoxidase